MRSIFVLFSAWFFLFASIVFAEEYRSEHFVIYSDLDPRLVEVFQKNCEAFYENLHGKYFSTGWSKPLAVYYSKNHSDTFKLLYKHNLHEEHKDLEARASYHFPTIPAIYTHLYVNETTRVGLGSLFHEITHQFVQCDFGEAPAWFHEGLACFFGDKTAIVKGEAILGVPEPWYEFELKQRIDKGMKPNLKRLFATTRKKLYNWPIGYNFSRAFFYWLYEKGKLEQYLKNAKAKGYTFEVLQDTLNQPYREIKEEFFSFIKKNCYAGAYLMQSRLTEDPEERKRSILKALKLMPQYREAQYDLAKWYYQRKDYKNCQWYLGQILKDQSSVYSCDAAMYMGRCFYDKKGYDKALQYLRLALDHSDYEEYKYELYYRIANCYHYLENYEEAKKFYKIYLENNWEPQKSQEEVEYSKKYTEWNESSEDANKHE